MEPMISPWMVYILCLLGIMVALAIAAKASWVLMDIKTRYEAGIFEWYETEDAIVRRIVKNARLFKYSMIAAVVFAVLMIAEALWQ